MTRITPHTTTLDHSTLTPGAPRTSGAPALPGDGVPEAVRRPSGDVLADAMVLLSLLARGERAQQRALRHGEERRELAALRAQASSIREAAGTMRTQAWISGGLLAGSAAFRGYQLSTTVTAMNAHNAGDLTGAARTDTVSQLNAAGAELTSSGTQVVGSWCGADAKLAEAEGAEATAQARIHASRTEDLRGAEREASEAARAALDAVRAIVEAREASSRAVLRA